MTFFGSLCESATHILSRSKLEFILFKEFDGDLLWVEMLKFIVLGHIFAKSLSKKLDKRSSFELTYKTLSILDEFFLLNLFVLINTIDL